MSIEKDAKQYIEINYKAMASTKSIYADEFPGDDHFADPTEIGELTGVSLGNIEQGGEGDLVVPFSFTVEAELTYREGKGGTSGIVEVSGELWGEEKPFREYNDDPDYVDENPRDFRYSPSGLAASLQK